MQELSISLQIHKFVGLYSHILGKLKKMYYYKKNVDKLNLKNIK